MSNKVRGVIENAIGTMQLRQVAYQFRGRPRSELQDFVFNAVLATTVAQMTGEKMGELLVYPLSQYEKSPSVGKFNQYVTYVEGDYRGFLRRATAFYLTFKIMEIIRPMTGDNPES